MITQACLVGAPLVGALQGCLDRGAPDRTQGAHKGRPYEGNA